MTPEQGGIPLKGGTIGVRQFETLCVISRGNDDGSYVDRYQIRNRLSYSPDVQAVHFSLRYLVAQGRAEIVGKVYRLNKNGARFKTRVYKVTELGMSFISKEW